jgi:hypothetical protein
MAGQYLKQVGDIMKKVSNNSINFSISYKESQAGIFDLLSYYGSNEQEYKFIKKLMDMIDDLLFEKNKKDIKLNNEEINLLLKFIKIIQKESEIWDEWSIITGKSLKELEEFKNIFRLKKIH